MPEIFAVHIIYGVKALQRCFYSLQNSVIMSEFNAANTMKGASKNSFRIPFTLAYF